MRVIFRPALAAVACVISLVAHAATDTPHKVDVAAGDLSAALQQLAGQSGVELIYSTEQLKGLRTRGVHGDYTIEKAVSELLRGTNLTVTVHASGAMLVAPPNANDSQPHSTAPAADSRSPELRDRLRLARADQETIAGPSALESNSATTDEPSSRRVLEEVIVTGSHIRGVRNDTTPMLTLDRDYIDRSGYSNMTQLVQSLPVNFSGGSSGASETAAFGNSPYAGQNLTRGTGFNLHGLGSVATLTLINGRRVAPAGEGQFVDISNIPLAAVERVEILTDGASAVYGADAVGGVVNIILRKNFDGAETSIEGSTATRGGTSQERVSQTFGRSWGTGNALLVGDFSRRDPLDARDRDYIVAAGGAPLIGPSYLLPQRNSKSLVFNLNQNLPEHFDLVANVLYSHEHVRQARTDLSDTVETDDPVTNQWSALLGVGYQPFGDWRFELDGSASQMETVTDFTDDALPSGEITFLINDYRDKFQTWSTDFKADGSLFSLPAGRVRLAAGASYRKDKLHSDRVWIIPDNGYQLHGDDQRNVKSVFTELFVPLVGKQQGVPWVQRIDLSVAARYDDYSDFGSTTNPKAGLVWTPVDSLDLRASYGKSFRAPTVAEKALVSRGQQISNTTVDAPGGGTVPIFYLAGSSPLSAEKSKDFTVGFTFKPAYVPGTELSVNYFNLDYTGRISTPPFEDGMLFERGKFGSLITDIPDDAAAQAYLDRAIASGYQFIDQRDPSDNGSAATGVRHVFDWRQKNAARSKIDGVDVTLGSQISLDVNTLAFNVNYTRINKIKTSLLSDTSTFDEVNTYEQPLKNRVRAMTTWLRGGWSSTAVLNYSNSYTNSSVLPAEPIKAWTTVDLNLSYDFGSSVEQRWLAGSKIALSVTNLFDVNPPHADDPVYSMGFDVFNADALGRYVTLRLAKRW